MIVKLNNATAAKVLRNQFPEEVTQILDAQLKSKNITDKNIRAARCGVLDIQSEYSYEAMQAEGEMMQSEEKSES